MPDPSEPLLTPDEEALLETAIADVSESPSAGEHKPIFDVSLEEGQWLHEEGGKLFVQHKGWFCGSLDVPKRDAGVLAKWIEAYPLVTEAAKVNDTLPASKHKSIYRTHIIANNAIVVREHWENGDLASANVIRLSRLLHLRSLAAWIEAYPSLTEAAKVKVPKP